MRVKSLVVSIIISFVSLITIICLIWWNESVGFKNKKLVKTIDLGSVEVDINNIDAKNDGKLVYVNGNLDYSEDGAGDYFFDVYVDSAKLERIVEKYQYNEVVEEDENGNKIYKYEKVWSSSFINSNKFNNKSIKNTSDFKYESTKFYAEDIKIGSYKLSESLKEQIQTKKEYTKLDPVIASAYDLKINGKYYTDSAVVDNPEIGDIRISFVYSDTKTASVLAMQSFDSFITFTTSKGITYNKLLNYDTNKLGIIKIISDDNNLLRWNLRLSLLVVLFALMFLSLRPVTKLVDKFIYFGKINRNYLIVLSILLSFMVYLIEAALVWLVYDYIISLLLFAAIVAIVIVILVTGKQNRIKTYESEMVLYTPEVLEDTSKKFSYAVSANIKDEGEVLDGAQ